MIQIELPCCDAIAELEPEDEAVRCEACAVEHLLAPDDRPAHPVETPRAPGRGPVLRVAA
jgi:hypothetical protein